MNIFLGIVFWILLIIFVIQLKRDGEFRVREWVTNNDFKLINIAYRPYYFSGFIGRFHPATFVVVIQNEDNPPKRSIVSVGGIWYPFSKELKIHDEK